MSDKEPVPEGYCRVGGKIRKLREKISPPKSPPTPRSAYLIAQLDDEQDTIARKAAEHAIRIATMVNKQAQKVKIDEPAKRLADNLPDGYAEPAGLLASPVAGSADQVRLDIETEHIEEPYWFGKTLTKTVEFYTECLHNAYSTNGQAGEDAATRLLAENDLFFMLVYICGRRDMLHPWLFDRCREYQAEPNNVLDLWARDHYKSTIITFGGNLRRIIRNPEVTIGIFSHTRPAAKKFLKQIKNELEMNPKFHILWPHIFYSNPKKESPKWSEDEGIVVKRKTNPKEATIEAWGLVDGQPIGTHYMHRHYDDIVVKESVGSPDMIEKTTDSYKLSNNLGTDGGTAAWVGTRYHMFDTYSFLIGIGKRQRVHPCTENGKEDGIPVLLSRETIREKRIEQGPYVFGAQMLLNPVADTAMGFDSKWLVHGEVTREQALTSLNRYILVDPASKKKKGSDYTAIWVIGYGADGNYYVLDIVRDRLNLSGRTKAVFDLHRKWEIINPVIYEEYGLQADIEHMEYVMEQKVYRFSFLRVGGTMSKTDRILRLVPLFERGAIILPKTLAYKDYQNRMVDLVKIFTEEEYTAFPVILHDDMLDCLARIEDEEVKNIFTKPAKNAIIQYSGYNFEDRMPSPGEYSYGNGNPSSLPPDQDWMLS